MASNWVGKRLALAIWNGPFFIGKLTQPASVGDVLLKLLETAWRLVVSVVALLLVLGLSLAAWIYVIGPTFFPPLKDQIVATAVFDDGTAEIVEPPPISAGVGSPPSSFRCTPDYPIKVLVYNDSAEAVGSIDFSIKGRFENFTEDRVANGSWRQLDRIIPSGTGWASCWAVTLDEGVSPSDLTYEVEVWRATAAQS